MFTLAKCPVSRCAAIAGLLSMLPAHAAGAGWQRAGLQGTPVTALISARTFGETLLVAGTASRGVWYRSGGQAFQHLNDLAGGTQPAWLAAIHCLYASGSLPRIFAGGDSGLAYYSFTSGLPPQWTRVGSVPAKPVTAIAGSGDTIFCCTGDEIYRSTNGGTTWAACGARESLPRLGNVTSFTSLAFWQGVNAGSRSPGAMNSWEGVLHSGDLGRHWFDISLLPGQQQHVGQVHSLLCYAPRWDAMPRLAAGTADGVRFVVDVDTGTWHPLEQQLKPLARHLYASYHSRSAIADLFASTDSGVYILTSLVNAAGWFRSLDLPARAVTSHKSMDPAEWFAATSDGVWRFTLNGSATRRGRPSPASAGAATRTESRRTANGSLLPAAVSIPGNGRPGRSGILGVNGRSMATTAVERRPK